MRKSGTNVGSLVSGHKPQGMQLKWCYVPYNNICYNSIPQTSSEQIVSKEFQFGI